jgi:hypothetical protein
MRARAACVVAGLAIASVIGSAGAASADPKGEPIPLVCDNGSTYQVTVNGNGAFTPGHDLASTSVLVPTAFGELHGVVTDSSGNVIDDFVDPAMVKGSSGDQARATTTTCTFTLNETFEDPDLGLLTFVGEGSVTGFITPLR